MLDRLGKKKKPEENRRSGAVLSHRGEGRLPRLRPWRHARNGMTTNFSESSAGTHVHFEDGLSLEIVTNTFLLQQNTRHDITIGK